MVGSINVNGMRDKKKAGTFIEFIRFITTFFFNLEHKRAQEKQMLCLKNNNGHCISDPVEMRRLDVDFYSHLYSAKNVDIQTQNKFQQNLSLDSGLFKNEVQQ